MPFRVEFRAGDDAFDRLVELGALDVECADDGTMAALLPDSVGREQVARAVGVDEVSVSSAVGRDAGSTWLLGPRAVCIGRIRIVPADIDTDPAAVRLIDALAFGTGLHPTTALCVEALDDIVQYARPDRLLDVGTGSGVLALAALTLGVDRAVAIDRDTDALRVAAANARLNGLESRVRFVCGGPEALGGRWPLAVANILAAPLIEIAPALARCVAHHGRLVLSGIPRGVARDVEHAYVNRGMRLADVRSRAGWIALVLQAAW